MAGPLSSVGYETGFALQSILKPPQRDAACFAGQHGKPYAPAAIPASEAPAVVSLVGHQLLPALLDPPLPEEVGEPYFRGTPPRRPLHSIHKTPSGVSHSPAPRLSFAVAGTPTAVGRPTARPPPPGQAAWETLRHPETCTARRALPILGCLG